MTGEQQFFNSFGKRLAALRKSRGITQAKLAEMIGVHRTYIGFIEQGTRNPSLSTIYKITLALKVSLNELFEPYS